MAPGSALSREPIPTARPNHPFNYALQVVPEGGWRLVKAWMHKLQDVTGKIYEGTAVMESNKDVVGLAHTLEVIKANDERVEQQMPEAYSFKCVEVKIRVPK
ncbi:hypothetical protein H2199_005515 [Coniosporium tulheliwenetii]|uniref:Uncharacterized protein n=1 Tax=Coniosporium tulheliwenetii TaxID=3383036 RepID=A0ACC2Z286_9PEZI|nr:hypothetical protein H2199_005515 [Cladosporium sp. JES 115]